MARTFGTSSPFADRVDLALVENEPDFPWWDHEAAAVDERYNDQEAVEVAGALRVGAQRLAVALPPSR
ncbi:MAG: hypothetical protein M3P34_10975 [Actinomycetota bacterium]|nr:hypothetical protein [Actinomycetota bacterium]